MFAKRESGRATPGSRIPKESLDRLYDHHLAIDALIESLEEYDRYRSERLDERKRKTA